MNRDAQTALFATLILFCAISCGPAGPNVLILSIDSLRADAIREDSAPALSRFAAESVVFRNAVSPAPWTTPAMMSVMTGLPAAAHGVDEHDRALAQGVGTLAERFRKAGWETSAFVPEVTLRAAFGFDRGFDTFDESRYGHARLSSPEMIGRVMHRIEGRGDAPFFIWAHLWDPHYNYTPPAELARRFARGERPASEDVQCLKWRENPVGAAEAAWLHGQQEAEVFYTDRHVGKLLDYLDEQGLADSTIVVILADHGEAFLEHGWLGHTNRLDEPVIRVPLMMRGPGLAGPASVESPVGSAGLGRRVLRLAGLDGASFGLEHALPVVDEGPSAIVLAETRRRGCLTAVREERLKLIIEHGTCAARLYDVVADPAESSDLAPTSPGDVERLTRALREKMSRIDEVASPAARLEMAGSAEANDALRSLGYLPSSGPGVESRPADPCALKPGEAVRDSFGDVVLDRPCPQGGVRACLLQTD